MERDNNIGVIVAQSLTEPLTQASLSSFHFLERESSRDTITEFGKILSGNFEEVLVEVDCRIFDPFKSFHVNFYEFSKRVTKHISKEDIKMGNKLMKEGIISENYYLRNKSITSIIISQDAPYSVSYLCFYLMVKDSMKRRTYIPFSNKRIDIICDPGKMREVDQIVYGTSIDEGKLVLCNKFDDEKYAQENTMTFMIKDCDLEVIQQVKGIVSFEFQNYKKIVKYYGIEYLRDFIKEKLSFIVGDDESSDMVADFLTYKGRFTTENSSKLMVWLKDLGTRGLDANSREKEEGEEEE